MLIVTVTGFFIVWVFNNRNVYLVFISLIGLLSFSNITEIFVWLVIIFTIVRFFSFYRDKSLKTRICYILFSLSSLSIIISNSTLVLWLNIEVQSFSVILISLFGGANKINKVEALIKYFFISLTASILLVGYQSVVLTGSNSSSIILSGEVFMEKLIIFLFYSIIIFKLGGFPFNFWVPEVYGSLPIKNLFIFIVVPKITFLIILLKFSVWHNYLLIVGSFSILIGSLNIVNQNSIKKIIAWSSVSNLGLIILCFSENPVKTNFSFFIFSSIYFFTLLILVIFLIIKNKNLIVEFINIFVKKSFISIIILIVFLSFLGLPPLAGFFSKILVFLSLLSSSSLYLSVVLISITLISAFAYLRIINLSINNTKKNFFYWNREKEEIKNNYFLLFILTYFIIFWFLNPNIIMTVLK